MILLSGKKIAKKIQTRLRKEIVRKKIKPTLAIILVGDNRISKIYIKEKEKACQEVGIKIKKYFLADNIGEEKILRLIDGLNDEPKITAVLVQLPLPASYDTDKILNKVSPEKDVDGLGSKPLVIAPTAQAIMEIFHEYNIKLKNKKICLIGYGRLVGRPLASLLTEQKLNFTIYTKKNIGFAESIKNADIVISATGVPSLIQKNMIKKGAIVIDAGTSVAKSKNPKKLQATSPDKVEDPRQSRDYKLQVLGDVDFDQVKRKASHITPSRGGVGPVTVAKLLENIVKLAKIKVKKGLL